MNDFVPNQPGAEAVSAESHSAETPQVTSLDSLSEFEFQGERYTPDRLHQVLSEYKNLSERVKSSADDERYLANIDADIETVLDNPKLADKFKQIYPKKFHPILDKVLSKRQAEATQGQIQKEPSAIPKEFLDEFGQLKAGYQQIAKQLHEYAVQSANAKIEAVLPKLMEKYPMAIEDQVLSRAEALLDQGYKLTDQAWERLVKESHASAQKKADAFYKKQMQTQLTKAEGAKDGAPGGATPGQAPKKIKSFADAERAMMEHLKSQGF